jgi:hypothetical protein
MVFESIRDVRARADQQAVDAGHANRCGPEGCACIMSALLLSLNAALLISENGPLDVHATAPREPAGQCDSMSLKCCQAPDTAARLYSQNAPSILESNLPTDLSIQRMHGTPNVVPRPFWLRIQV